MTNKKSHAKRSVGVLIVGGGEAAIAAAQQLRDSGYEHSVLIASTEPVAPYQRPPLSKEYLQHAVREQDVELRAPEFYADMAIEVLTDTRIEQARHQTSGHGVAYTDNAQVPDIAYDHLLITTGAQPRPLEVPGAQLAGVHVLRSLSDARTLRAALKPHSKVVIIGTGFIGLEAAANLNSMGHQVTVVGNQPNVLARTSATEISDFLIAAHRKNGIEFLLPVDVQQLNGDAGSVREVELSNGQRLAADVIIVGIGAIPETQLAKQMGLRCEHGVVVDEHGRTSDPTVLAAGDCTVGPHPHLEDALFGAESVQNAITQGKRAANTLLGQEFQRSTVPWFWSDQAEYKIQIAGISAGATRSVVRGKDEDGITVLYFMDEKLIAADCINRPADFMAVRRALGKNLGVVTADLTDASQPLKQLLSAAVPV